MIGDPGYDKQTNEQWSFGYLLEHKLDDVWTLRQNFRQANLKSVYASLNADTLTGNVMTRATTIYHSQVDNTVPDNQAEARFRWGPTQHTLLLGVDWLRMTDREVRFRGSAPSLKLKIPKATSPMCKAKSRFWCQDKQLRSGLITPYRMAR